MLKELASMFRRTRRDAVREQHLECSIEPLEDRRLLAGNVAAAMRGGNLTIRGDNFSNSIDVFAIANGVRVVGSLDPNGASTTVNGAAFADFSGSSIVPGNVRISLKGGQDRVALAVNINGKLAINSGSGSDLVQVTSLVGGNLSINAGSADNLFSDSVNIVNTNVQGKARVKGGGQSQQLVIQNSNFFNRSNFNLGGGNDSFVVVASAFQNLRANGGGGSGDQFQALFAAVKPFVRGFEVII